MTTGYNSPMLDRTRQLLWERAHRPSWRVQLGQSIRDAQDGYDGWTLRCGVAGAYLVANCQEMGTAVMLSALLAARHPGDALRLAKSLFSLEHNDLADIWHVVPFAVAYLEQPVQAVEHLVSHELGDARKVGAAALYLIERTASTTIAIAQHLLHQTA